MSRAAHLAPGHEREPLGPAWAAGAAPGGYPSGVQVHGMAPSSSSHKAKKAGKWGGRSGKWKGGKGGKGGKK